MIPLEDPLSCRKIDYAMTFNLVQGHVGDVEIDETETKSRDKTDIDVLLIGDAAATIFTKRSSERAAERDRERNGTLNLRPKLSC